MHSCSRGTATPWIAEGLARGNEADIDPVVELHHHLDAATRALRVLEGQRDAA
jgi:hypothetical protein